MAFTIRKSAIEPDLFEIWEGEQCVREIAVSFRIYKIPKSFDSLEKLERWLKETEWKLARGGAYRLLAIRSQSSSALRQKLERKRFSASVCEQVLEELQRNGYLDDEEFERSAILREFKKGYGPRYIEMKLRSKRVRELISKEMQRERAEQLFAKLGGGQKALRSLARRGFDPDIIRSYY